MRALVTGSAGFVGRHFVKRLVDDGWAVTRVDPRDDAFFGDAMDLFLPAVNGGAKFDLVVHAAARSPHRAAIDNAHGMHAHNTMLDAALFHWAIETQQPRVVYFSSSAVYSPQLVPPYSEGHGFIGEPFDAYGLTKRHGETLAKHAQRAGVDVIVLRPFSGYGSDQSEEFPFGAFIRRAIRREDPFVIWGDSRQTRDFVHIDDIVECALTLVDHHPSDPTSRRPVNVCTGIPTSMRELANRIISEVRHQLDPAYNPVIQVDANAPMGVQDRVGSPTYASQWHTPRVTLSEGIRRAVAVEVLREIDPV